MSGIDWTAWAVQELASIRELATSKPRGVRHVRTHGEPIFVYGPDEELEGVKAGLSREGIPILGEGHGWCYYALFVQSTDVPSVLHIVAENVKKLQLKV